MTKAAEAYSINALSIHTGYDRATLSKALSDIPADVENAKGKRWKMKTALRVIGAVKERANAKQPSAADIEKAGLARIQRQRLELKYAKEAGEYIRIDDLGGALQEVLMAMKSRLQAIPTKAAPRLVGAKKERDIQVLLEKMVNEALLELSRLNPDRFLGEVRKSIKGFPQGPSESIPSAETDRQPVGRRTKAS